MMKLSKNHADVVIIGAGAAGLMCAIQAGKRGRSVIVLERAETMGKKIRISGGGRCNFTNVIADSNSFLSANPHFCKSALARYTPADFIALVERHGIAYHEKTAGQLFCDNSAEEIISMLVKECDVANVQIVLNCNTQDVKKDDCFHIRTNLGNFESSSLVVATGGLSIPKIGATDFGYRIAKQFDIGITACKPGLVPLIWNDEDRNRFGELSGVSLRACVTCGKITFEENILFTHKGLSGPAILQISSYWNQGETLSIDLLPGVDIEKIFQENHDRKLSLVTVLSQYLPRRFAERWLEQYFTVQPMNRYSPKELQTIAYRLHAWSIIPAGTEGYPKAEVTVGGIDTGEISSKTMEAKKIPGLYFIGEIVDVTGHLGGYNFQWAWASGVAAGEWV
ncbi:MAG: NAD(P)/FAD-dependent oxidoreductase [Bacteroidota bacterium]